MVLITMKATELAKEDKKTPITVRNSKKYVPVLVKSTKNNWLKKYTKRYLRRKDIEDYLKETN